MRHMILSWDTNRPIKIIGHYFSSIQEKNYPIIKDLVGIRTFIIRDKRKCFKKHNLTFGIYFKSTL